MSVILAAIPDAQKLLEQITALGGSCVIVYQVHDSGVRTGSTEPVIATWPTTPRMKLPAPPPSSNVSMSPRFGFVLLFGCSFDTRVCLRENQEAHQEPRCCPRVRFSLQLIPAMTERQMLDWQ
jgi:hypothetical protein